MAADRTVTERGFTIYDQFFDSYENWIRVQESSNASGPHCWIFSSSGQVDTSGTTSAHLDIVQAERVRDALDAFIAEAKETLQAESLAAADLDEDRP